MFKYVYTNPDGDLLFDEDFTALGRIGKNIAEPLLEEMIPMPEGTTFVLLPDRQGIVMKFESFIPYPYPENMPVGVLLPQGYTRTLMPSFAEPAPGDQILPDYGYTMVGYKEGQFYVAAIKTNEDKKWNPKFYNTEDLPGKINKMKNRFPKNVLVKELSNYASNDSCFAAQNIFYERWEGGIPVSPNYYKKTADEIAELGINHLKEDDSIISFGLGFEGEPSLQAGLIADGIKKIRKKTSKGKINCNTSGGNTAGIKEIVDAGIDSLRVTINSGLQATYNAYFKGRNYSLEDVKNSLCYAAEKNCSTYLNLLVMPGVTDTKKEIEKLKNFIKESKVKKVKFSNLNVDPDQYLDKIVIEEEALGVLFLKEVLEAEMLDSNDE